jgi:hypothetical protein
VLRQLTNKFLHRVRIHGGEFDSSARAMNRAEQGDLFQAELRKFRGSTFERKQMSTTIKRVALVAVAALTLGVVSVAPSTAAINQDTLTLSAATAAQTTAETLTATSAVATLSFLGSAGDSASVTAALVSGPAGNTALPYLSLAETASATINEANAAAGSVTPPNTAVRVNAGSSSKVTTAKFAVYLGTSSTAAPTVAGTYVVKLTPASVGASGALLGSTAQTLTITVTTAPTLDTTVSATTSKAVLNVGETNTATADAVVTGSKVIATDAIGTIAVTLNNAAGSKVTSDSYTAVVASGPGLLGSGVFTNATYTFGATGRAITVRNGDVVGIFGDGSSGVSTIEIRTSTGVLIATEKVTFFGDIASIVATVAKPTIGVGTGTGAVTAKAYDAAGVLVSSGTLYAASSDATVFAATSATIDATTGVATFDLSGLKAGSANVTVGNKSTSPTVTASAVSVRVGSSTPASVSVTTDKSSYAPGEAAVISVVLLDDKGLTVADGVYNNIFATGGISGSYTISGLTDTTTVTIASGVGSRTVYMPVTEGDVKLSWTTGTNLATANQAVKGSVTVSVSSVATSAAIDAANEAAQAASDATDAALAAADAADAATTKAQEAVDAVATLSAQVSKLITALKAQITTLTNLVIKIQKKVKA